MSIFNIKHNHRAAAATELLQQKSAERDRLKAEKQLEELEAQFEIGKSYVWFDGFLYVTRIWATALSYGPNHIGHQVRLEARNYVDGVETVKTFVAGEHGMDLFKAQNKPSSD